MKTQMKPLILAGGLILSVSSLGHAQETLGGLGAAGAMGATLGAMGAGGLSSTRVTRSVGSGNVEDMGSSPEGGSGDPRVAAAAGAEGAGTEGGAEQEFSPAPLPRVQTFNGSGATFVRELLSGNPRPVPSSPKVAGSSRLRKLPPRVVARLSKGQRTRLVNSQYKIPPRGWLAAYLPQDRYKLGKSWRFVSTEDDRFYYTPAAMAGRRFNPNRVIGFASWREAMLAGYRPDPRTRPEPGAALASYANALGARLAVPAADLPEESADVQSFYRFVELVYAGQVDEEVTAQTIAYAKGVLDTLRAIPVTRWQAKKTSVVALETVLLQRPVTDLPFIAGSRQFEARIQGQKTQIRAEVEANNDRINVLAYPIAENLAYPPGTVARSIYEIQKARWEAKHETIYPDVEVASWIPAAIRQVESKTGLRVRNATNEIVTMLKQEQAKALTVRFRGGRAPSVSGGGGGRDFSGLSYGSWINHYLVADRNRILGGIWQYVSTDLDTRFYLPNDPRILRQPASRVIGFNSLNAALEAGYQPAEGGGINLAREVAAARREAKAVSDQRKRAAAEAAAKAAATQSAGGGTEGAEGSGRGGSGSGASPDPRGR